VDFTGHGFVGHCSLQREPNRKTGRRTRWPPHNVKIPALFLGGGCFGARRFFVHIAVPSARKPSP